MFSCVRQIQKFFQGGGTKVRHISSVVFFDKIILKQHIENKKGSRGSGGMLPQKIFENLHTVVAILAVVEQCLGKFSLSFCP